MCTVNVLNGELPEAEVNANIERAKQKCGKEPRHIDIKVCGDEVELTYDFGNPQPFNRLRRITGYLVGDVSRWNNGKHAELDDRVKHTM